MINEQTPPALRPLGGLERWFHQMHQHRSNHFCTAVNLSGRIDAGRLADALLVVQRRHPLLNAAVADGHDGQPHFLRSTGRPIPVRRAGAGGADALQREIEAELALPIDASTPPLVRTVLGDDADGSYLIVSIHHSIGDGMGAVFLLRDIVHALAGTPLPALDIPGSAETLRAPRRPATPQPAAEPQAGPQAEPEAAAQAEAQAAAPSNAYADPQYRARVDTVALSAADTARLVLAARRHGVTVHALLSAALLVTARRLEPAWAEGALRLFSPMDLRKSLGAGEGLRVAVGAALGVFQEAPDTGLWALAREALAQLAPFRQADNEFIINDMLGAAALDPATVVAVSGQRFAYELILSNLGNVAFGQPSEGSRITALWGPSVLLGFTEEQAIGAVTFDGRLRLVHTSYTPLGGLLAGAVAAVLDAVARDEA